MLPSDLLGEFWVWRAGDTQTQIVDGVTCGETEAYAQVIHQGGVGKLSLHSSPEPRGCDRAWPHVPNTQSLADPKSTHLLPLLMGLTPLQSHEEGGQMPTGLPHPIEAAERLPLHKRH